MKAELTRLFFVLGIAVAVAQSWHWNESIVKAIFHGLLNWVYVVIHILTY